MGISNDCANQQSNDAKLYTGCPIKIRTHNDFIMAQSTFHFIKEKTRWSPSGVVGIIQKCASGLTHSKGV